MFIYTSYQGRSLKLPVPADWSMEEVEYFVSGKEDVKPDFNPKPHLIINKEVEDSIDIIKKMLPEPIKPIPEPIQPIIMCKAHPAYIGYRRPRKPCPDCLALYIYRKEQGLKEVRGGKTHERD